jgi:type IV secretion system protein VirB2
MVVHQIRSLPILAEGQSDFNLGLRLYRAWASGVTTRFGHDGFNLIAKYDDRTPYCAAIAHEPEMGQPLPPDLIAIVGFLSPMLLARLRQSRTIPPPNRGGFMHFGMRRIAAVVSALSASLLAVPVQAQDTYADPAGSGVIVSAVNWLQGTLLGTVATVVAVIAVASVGFMMLTGRINWRHGGVVILGCFVLFGAASIVAGIQSAAAAGY